MTIAEVPYSYRYVTAPIKLEEKTTWDAVQEVALYILSVVLLPLTLLYYALEWASRAAIMRASTHWINSSQYKQPRIDLAAEGGKRLQIITPDGIKLDSMLFEAQKTATHAIIYFGGTNACYETDYTLFLRNFVHKYVSPHAHFLFVNPRGVVESEGRASDEGLALDVHSAHECMKTMFHIPADKIIPMGRSLGAGIVAKGAALIQKLHPNHEISLVHERSFKNLRSVFEVLCGEILSIPLKLLLHIMPLGNFTPVEDIRTLKGRVLVIHSHHDQLMHHEHASIFPVLSGDNNVRSVKLDHDETTQDPHSTWFSHEEMMRIGYEMQNFL